MAIKEYLFDDFEIGHKFPAAQYSISSEEADGFFNTYQYERVKNEQGEYLLDSTHVAAVRPVHPSLVASFHLQHAAFAWPFGVLHAREKVMLHKPVYSGDPLEAVIEVKDKFIRNDKRFLVLQIEVVKLENQQRALTVERTLVWPK